MPELKKFNFRIKNANTSPIVLWVEPWAHDFTLMAKEEIVVVVNGNVDPEFNLIVDGSIYQLYINGELFDWTAEAGGVPIACGYQREQALK